MIQVKCLLVGGVMGILSTLAGLAVAKADCSRDYETGVALASFGGAVDLAHERCDAWVQGLIEDGVPVEAFEGYDGAWEACIRLETPVGPLPAAQHYDTHDGAFWKVAGYRE